MTLFRKRSLWALPALALLTSACGDSPTAATDTTTAPIATVTAVGSPDPATATASGDAAYTWSGSFVANISNTNASALTLRSISADLQQSSGGIVVTPATGTDETFRFDVRAPGNRIDTNGTMTIPFTFYYTLPNGGREALVSLSFNALTDAGAAGAVTASVRLQ